MDSVFGKIRQQQSREDSWRNGDGIEGPGNVAILDSEATPPLPGKRFEGLQFNPRLGRDFFVFFRVRGELCPLGGVVTWPWHTPNVAPHTQIVRYL